MKKRTLIIFLFFTIAFITLCLTSCEATCVETNFDCDNEVACALFCSDQKGFRCSGEDISCEWYPFFCGLGYDDCINPVICGWGLCYGAPIDSFSFMSEIPNNATDLPVTSSVVEMKEDKDFFIQNVTYVLTDRNNRTYRGASFDDILNSDLYKQINKDSFNIQLIGKANYTISAEITVSAVRDMEFTASAKILKRSIYNSIMNDQTTTNHTQNASLTKGTNTITLSLGTREYIETQWNYSLRELKYTATAMMYSLGGS